MSTTTQALAAARAARGAARTRLESAAALLSRAVVIAAECQQEADRLADEEARWVERHSKKLTAWIEGGSRGARPAVVTDAKAVQAQMSARANAAAAADTLQQFEAAEREAAEGLAVAEQAVVAAVDAMLDAEGLEAAEGILHRAEEVLSLARHLPNRLNVPLNRLRDQPHVVQRAQALIEKLLPSDLDTPLSKLGGPSISAFRAGDDSYEERRSALIRGDGESLGEPSLAAQAG